MAIIQSYPLAQATASDTVLGTQVDGNDVIRTVTYNIAQMNTLATQGFIETTTVVNSVALNALQTSEVILITAPGPGKYIKVLELSGYLDFTAPVYTFGSAILVQEGLDTDAPVTLGSFPATFSQLGADAVYSDAIVYDGVLRANKALMLSTAGAVGNSGGSSLQVKVRYQVLDISAF
jgi:hypothetical protein